MTLTSASWAPASTAASSAPEPPSADASDGLCAIHQPNLFPRLSTLAKLFSADLWIVLDDVQFARRDYQHRARLAALDDPSRQQWLTLPTHLPYGRPTLISQARLGDPRRLRRTIQLLVRQYYGSSPYWEAVSDVLDALDKSRKAVLPEYGYESPVGKRVYYLRHTCLITWLNHGIRPAQVAE